MVPLRFPCLQFFHPIWFCRSPRASVTRFGYLPVDLFALLSRLLSALPVSLELPESLPAISQVSDSSWPSREDLFGDVPSRSRLFASSVLLVRTWLLPLHRF
jgi:hypothetical protein